MSFKIEVREPRSTEWVGNALRFATYKEADEYGHDLLCRWFLPEEYLVVESEDAVNYVFVEGRAAPI
jgi:hypothetical protein